MWSAEAVFVCALTLLGRSANSFPPVQFLSVVPSDVSPQAEAFVRINDPHIYIVTTGSSFQSLQQARDRCGSLEAARKLASILVHEEVHLRDDGDEAQAYTAQLTTLASLGAGAGSPLYAQVRRSMLEVLARPRPRLERVMVVR